VTHRHCELSARVTFQIYVTAQKELNNVHGEILILRRTWCQL
jgi:hypothetical protein